MSSYGYGTAYCTAVVDCLTPSRTPGISVVPRPGCPLPYAGGILLYLLDLVRRIRIHSQRSRSNERSLDCFQLIPAATLDSK